MGLDSLTSIQNLENLTFGPPQAGNCQLAADVRIGVTNSGILNKVIRATISVDFALNQRRDWFAEVARKWGSPQVDPFVVSGFCFVPMLKRGAFRIFIQPTRGYSLAKPSAIHSSFVVPCNFYCLSYVFYWRIAKGGLVVNMGKHGNLEWLPGKAVALSRYCYPEMVSGGLPSLYFFVTNDPGEGVQAKRRINTVIVSHDVAPVNSTGALGLSANALKTYSNLSRGYVCRLMDAHFRYKLHTLCDMDLHDIVNTTVLSSKQRCQIET